MTTSLYPFSAQNFSSSSAPRRVLFSVFCYSGRVISWWLAWSSSLLIFQAGRNNCHTTLRPSMHWYAHQYTQSSAGNANVSALLCSDIVSALCADRTVMSYLRCSAAALLNCSLQLPAFHSRVRSSSLESEEMTSQH